MKGISGLVIAPADQNALAPFVQEAIDEGIPVAFVDSRGINEGVPYIGTNNESAAHVGAEYICKNVPKGAKVAMLTGVMSQTPGIMRAKGAKEGLQKCGLNIVAEISASWDKAKGLAATEDIITGNPDLAALYAGNDNMALGAVEALKTADMLDQVMVVGFDANPDAAVSVLAGEMSATVAQDPVRMGSTGVDYVVKMAAGKSVSAETDTGAVLVTKSNAEGYK